MMKPKPYDWYDHAVTLGIDPTRKPWPLRGQGPKVLGYCIASHFHRSKIFVVADHAYEFFVGWHEIAHASVLRRTQESSVWIRQYEKYTAIEEAFADSVALLACEKWGHEHETNLSPDYLIHVAMPHAKYLFENLCKELV